MRTMEGLNNLRVSEVNIYPVKSCAGIALTSGRVVDTGFEHDREWMIVDGEGNFITQRQHPKLALVSVILFPGGVRLAAEGRSPLDVPILIEGTRIQTEVWESPCIGIDQGESVESWLTDFMGRQARLIRMAPDFKRPVKEKYQSEKKEVVGFADGFPFLLISEASLEDLNSRLAEKLPMNRFRPNIVVAGGTPYQEDAWQKIKIGDVVLRAAKPCSRCEITTVDQATGEKGIEPLETLGTYRTKPKGIMFGQNLAHEGPGTIAVGDPVELL